MIIQLTDEQVIRMAKLAILASVPVGLGFLHYQSNLKEEDISLDVRSREIYIDYYQGRMVKFQAHKNIDGTWEFPNTTSYDYQSWKHTYPTYAELAKAVDNV